MATLSNPDFSIRARLTTDIVVALTHVRHAETALRSRVQLARDLGVDVDEIAKACGMSRATVYRRYLTENFTDAYVGGRCGSDES